MGHRRWWLLDSLASSIMSTTPVYETIQDHDQQAQQCHNNGSNHSSSSSTSLSEGGQDGNGPTTPALLSKELINLVLCAAATASTLGFDVGIMAAAIQPLTSEMHLSAVQKEVAMGSLNFFAAAGALLGGTVANQYGRKPTVRVCAWLFVVGTVCMAAAPNFGILLLGRIVTGIGVGVSFVVAPVYLSEVAPTDLRGQLNTVFDVAINGGILLGYVVGFLVQVILPNQNDNDMSASTINSLKWRTMLGLGLVLPVIVLANLKALPESPRWLVMKQQTAQASEVLASLGENPRQVIRTVSSIQEELQSDAQPGNPGGSDLSMLCHAPWSPGMRFAVAIGFWQQITGTEAVLYYSADFLEHAGLQSATQRLLGNCAVGLCKLVPELLAMRVVDKLGRRPLILTSAVALTLSTATLAVAFWQHWSPLTVVILLCAIMASFSIGLGPFSFLLASENLGLVERASGVTLCAATNRCTSGMVAMTAVSLYSVAGPAGLFALYAAVGAASLPFYFTAVHETSGQTLEELAARQRGQQTRAHTSDGLIVGQQQQAAAENGTCHVPFSDTPHVEGTMT